MGTLTCLKLHMQMIEGGKHGETQEDTIFETPRTYRTKQPRISDEDRGDKEDEENVDVGGGGEDPLDLDDVEDEEKGLIEDELWRIQKGDSIDILSELRMKPEELFRLHIPLCRVVAMPMVRPTLACDITKLE